MLYADFEQKIRVTAKHFLANAKKTVGVLAHVDTDGVCSAAILFRALERAGYTPKIHFIRRMSEDPVKNLKRKKLKTWVFADYGCKEVNKYAEAMPERFFYVLDHHKDTVVVKNGINVNPNDFGADGGSEVSGSTLCFLFACELGDNYDLADVALAGAVGDMQRINGKFKSINAEIEKNATQRQIISKMGDSLILPNFPIAELSDARDLSSFLNSCTHIDPDAALHVALGDRAAFTKYKGKVEKHTASIESGVDFYRENENDPSIIKKTENAIFFFAQGKIKAELAGTVSTILSRRLGEVGKVLFVFAETNGKIKVSSRIIREKTNSVDLNVLMKLAIPLGGEGGGHVVAAGCWVPKEKLNELLKQIKKYLSRSV